MSFDTSKLEAPTTPSFSDSKSNSIDLLRLIHPRDASKSMLVDSMEEALSAQARFQPKKSYNLEDLSFDEAQSRIKNACTDRGKKEVSVVADLIATRNEDGKIVKFVMRAGQVDLNLDMNSIDGMCGGPDGRELFYKRNRHGVKGVPPTATKFRLSLDKHGLKTSGERVMSISANLEVLGIRNFQNTSAEYDFEKRKEVDCSGDLKFKKRLKPWDVFRSVPYASVEMNPENGILYYLTSL